MYTHEKGDMWSAFDNTDHFLITTNRIVKRDGGLVMGAGIAKTARDRWPGLDKKLGTAIKQAGAEYGVILGKKIGIFQVKNHFKEEACLKLIEQSAKKLAEVANSNPEKRYDLNFPGIGNGKRQFNDVEPLLQVLPSNVHVWTFT